MAPQTEQGTVPPLPPQPSIKFPTPLTERYTLTDTSCTAQQLTAQPRETPLSVSHQLAHGTAATSATAGGLSPFKETTDSMELEEGPEPAPKVDLQAKFTAFRRQQGWAKQQESTPAAVEVEDLPEEGQQRLKASQEEGEEEGVLPEEGQPGSSPAASSPAPPSQERSSPLPAHQDVSKTPAEPPAGESEAQGARPDTAGTPPPTPAAMPSQANEADTPAEQYSAQLPGMSHVPTNCTPQVPPPPALSMPSKANIAIENGALTAALVSSSGPAIVPPVVIESAEEPGLRSGAHPAPDNHDSGSGSKRVCPAAAETASGAACGKAAGTSGLLCACITLRVPDIVHCKHLVSATIIWSLRLQDLIMNLLQLASPCAR